MTDSKRFFAGNTRTWFLIGVVLGGFSLSVWSAEPIESLRADQLVQEAEFLLTTDRAGEAIPYLEEYLSRTAESQDFRVKVMAQDVRLKLGQIFIKQNSFDDAVEQFREYVDRRPALKWHEVMKLWSTTLLEAGKYEECARVTELALQGAPEDVLKEMEEEAQKNQTDDSQSADGYQFDEYGEIIEEGSSDSATEPAGNIGFSGEDLLVLNMTLGDAYKELDSDKRIDPFLYVVEHTKDPIHKGYAIMEVVNGLIKKRDFDRLTSWIPQLYRTDARYDIRVNIALMNAATALFDAKEHDNALPLYRMILPRAELINHYVARAWEIRLKENLATPDQVPPEYRTRIDETLFGKRYAVVPVEETWSEEERENPNLNKPEELLELERLVETIKSLPPYEQEVLYRTAYLYDEVNRPWEAVRFFDRIYSEDPESDMGERSFYEVIRILLDPLEQTDEAERRSYAFLDKERDGILPRQIAYLLGSHYQQSERVKDVKRLLPYLEGFEVSDEPLAERYDCELWYMQAVADMVLTEYAKAEAGFDKVLTDYPGSHQEDNAMYWKGVAVLFLERYEDALDTFEDYLTKFPQGNWVASAAFQRGTCLFGLERYDEAFAQFGAVINTYPDSNVYPDACNLRGDIYASRGELTLALNDYRNGFSSAKTQAQGKYSTFQMASVLEMESRYDEILEVVERYLATYGDEADIAMGVYWIGKTKVNQGLIDEAVESYFDAIVQYGDDLEQQGVDSIIAELIRLSRQRLSSEEQQDLRVNLEAELAQAENQTLSLRLRAMLAEMDGTTIELGRALIDELDSLDAAAPPVLAAISDASFAEKDYSRAAEILNVFKTQFEDSEYMRPVFRLYAFGLVEKEEDEEALKIVADAQARYGTEYDMAWAQLMKGRIELRKGEHQAAAETFKAVLNVRDWRGDAFAEATYRLGEAEEASGNLLKAHGWYQRTYVQYKGYRNGEWAADAYLGSARCLMQLGLENDARNTYRAMLFDKYINELPQAETARKALGEEEVLEIQQWISQGLQTNISVTVEMTEENN